MFPLNDYVALKDYQLNREPVVAKRAEEHRILAEAGLIRRPWLTCQACRALWRFGRMLIAAGRHLEQRYEHLAFQPA